MFGSRQSDRSRQMFLNQFERDGSGYLYRRNMRSAAIRVSAEDRDRFVSGFQRAYPRMIWGLTGVILVYIALLVVVFPDANGTASNVALYGGVAVAFVVFYLVWRRVWQAPARALAGRPAVGASRSRTEVRRALLSRLSWGQIAGGAAAAAFGWWQLARGQDLLSGWHRLWLLLGVALLGLFAWQAFSKWRVGAGG